MCGGCEPQMGHKPLGSMKRRIWDLLRSPNRTTFILAQAERQFFGLFRLRHHTPKPLSTWNKSLIQPLLVAFTQNGGLAMSLDYSVVLATCDYCLLGGSIRWLLILSILYETESVTQVDKYCGKYEQRAKMYLVCAF